MLTCVSSVSSSVAPHQWTVSDCLWLISLVISVCNRVLCELTAISLRLSETTVCRSVNRWKQLQWAFHMILQLKLSQSTSIYFWSMMLTAVGGVSVILISVCVCVFQFCSVGVSQLISWWQSALWIQHHTVCLCRRTWNTLLTDVWTHSPSL